VVFLISSDSALPVDPKVTKIAEKPQKEVRLIKNELRRETGRAHFNGIRGNETANGSGGVVQVKTAPQHTNRKSTQTKV
jgi:hypothetical protein